jgi:GT2 family glycosyltransferase
LLLALGEQTLGPDTCEVIVSIDGSTDGTREMVERLSVPYPVKVRWQPHRGRAAACNTGIRLATGDLVVLFDDDVIPVPTCLAAHVRAHERRLRQAVSGAVPIPLTPDSPPVVAYVGRKFNRHLERICQPGYEVRPRDFPTANFSICRSVLLEVGAFDESFQAYGNEDVDLSVRLLRAGISLVYEPAALAYQHYDKDFGTLARDSIAKGRTSVTLARKHPEIVNELRLSEYRAAPWRWRIPRAILLTLSTPRLQMSDRLVGFLTWLGTYPVAGMHLYYDLALDYFYWLGVVSALEECRMRGQSAR